MTQNKNGSHNTNIDIVRKFHCAKAGPQKPVFCCPKFVKDCILATPFDPDTHSLIGWALSGIGAAIMGAVGFVYNRLRRLNKIETEKLVEDGLQEFENTRIMPILNRLDGRVTNVERLEASMGVVKAQLESLHDNFERNAEEASKQLTGAMNRISEQRREDKEIQLERLDSLKQLIEAKMK